MIKWKEHLNGDCPKRDARLYERCNLICPDLPKVLRRHGQEGQPAVEIGWVDAPDAETAIKEAIERYGIISEQIKTNYLRRLLVPRGQIEREARISERRDRPRN
jgi:hypothetical protein